MRISDLSSDVCSSDLQKERSYGEQRSAGHSGAGRIDARFGKEVFPSAPHWGSLPVNDPGIAGQFLPRGQCIASVDKRMVCSCDHHQRVIEQPFLFNTFSRRSEEHTSELQSLMRISYAVFCLKKKTTNDINNHRTKST